MTPIHQIHDKEDFDAQIKAAGSKLVVIENYAQWACTRPSLSSALDELSKTLSNVVFLKADVDEFPALASGFHGLPSLVAFLQGRKVAIILGGTGEKLRKLISDYKK